MKQKYSICNFKRSLFNGCESLAGMDSGGSLTKIVFATKESVQAKDKEDIELVCVSFLNSKLKEGLLYLKEKSCLKEGDTLHVTGLGGSIHKDLIESTLNVKTLFIEEIMSQVKGSHFVVKNGDPDNLYYRDNLPKTNFSQMNGTFDLICQQLESSLTPREETANSRFPIVIAILGSASGFLKISEDGSSSFAGTQWFGGKTFLGLGKMLLDTKDYNEIIDLANVGNGKTTDLFISDLVPQDSPYVNADNNNEVFMFGRVADEDKDGQSKEDLANSLVKLTATATALVISEACWNMKTRNLVIAGNLARAEIFRSSIRKEMMWSDPTGNLNMEFMKTGHTGAIGAMVSTKDTKDEFLAKLH